MATTEVERIAGEPGGEAGRVVRWRECELLKAGYDAKLALELALRNHVDLHRAVDLLRRGCPPATAAQILL
jgi:hypothetical protein